MLAVAVADGANSNITVRNQLRLSTTSSPSPVGRGTGGGAQTLHQRYFLRGRCFDLAKHPLSPSDSSPYQGERIFWISMYHLLRRGCQISGNAFFLAFPLWGEGQE